MSEIGKNQQEIIHRVETDNNDDIPLNRTELK